MKNIVLIGMPGAGKSTVGVLLAKSLLMDFCDTDLVLQQQCKMSLCDIIAQNGIADFIATENRIVSGLTFENCVVATGGSVVYGEQAMQNLCKNGRIVYLQVDADELEKRICNIKTRGIAMKEGTTIAQLYAERARLYEQYADITVNCTHLKPEECVDRIVAQLKKRAENVLSKALSRFGLTTRPQLHSDTEVITMGRMICKCGCSLSNVDSPSSVDLWGFEKRTLQKIKGENVPLSQVVLDYHIPGLYFWHCKNCGRVYVFNDHHQMYHRIYLKQECNEKDPASILQMRELLFFTDEQIETPTEADDAFSLDAFLADPPHPYRFFITQDEKTVFAYDSMNQRIAHSYRVEMYCDDNVNA